jgi:hypothetical protein
MLSDPFTVSKIIKKPLQEIVRASGTQPLKQSRLYETLPLIHACFS